MQASDHLTDMGLCSLCKLPHRLHLMGIAGQGMTGLAGLLNEHGHVLTACDTQNLAPDVDPLHQLALRLTIPVAEGNSSIHLLGAKDLGLIYASTIAQDHAEISMGEKMDLPTLPREVALSGVLRAVATSFVAVTGVAGKSTTTSMLAFALRALGRDPTVYLGAVDPNLGGLNYHLGTEPIAVFESCEYRRACLTLPRTVGVITNMYWGEHLESYRDPVDLKACMHQFLSECVMSLVCADYPETRELLTEFKDPQTLTYGVSPDAIFRLKCQFGEKGGRVYEFMDQRSGASESIALQTIGEHNYLNALAAAAMLLTVFAVPLEVSTKVLSGFRPLLRRLEFVGSAVGWQIFDDYAHHPAQLYRILPTLRESLSGGKLVVYFQPTVRRRLHELRDQYLQVFREADTLLLGEIATGTADCGEEAVTSEQLARYFRSEGICSWVATPETVGERLPQLSGEDGILLVCGARRAGGVARSVLRAMSERRVGE
jgi:UDP-N-acetylmuramate--alanine ligase